MKHIFLILLLTTPLYAEHFKADSTSSTYQLRPDSKLRTDVFDFSGAFPLLETIDIDAKRKKLVELDLSGEYPILETINFNGSFGTLTGDLSGDFPKLELLNVLCSNCAMQLDLSGLCQTSCEINIRGMKENIEITLPENIGLIIHTRTAPKGKVIVRDDLKKQGWLKFLKKTYTNELAEESDIVLTLNIELTEGRIILH